MSNHYETLGVSKDASQDEIKKAWRAAAKKYHPDHNVNDSSAEEKIKKINEAYDVLKDPNKRAEYDSPTHNPFSNNMGGNGMDGFPFDVNDIFNEFFGGGGHAHPNRRGRHQQTKTTIVESIQVPLMDMINGSTFQFSLKMPFREPKPITVTLKPNTPVGTEIVIPPEEHKIESINQIVLRVSAASDPRNRVEIHGVDIYTEVLVDVFDVITKKDVKIKLPTGKSVKVSIPTDIRDGKKIRLTGKGLMSARGEIGDTILVVSLRIPKLTEKQRLDINKIIESE